MLNMKNVYENLLIDLCSLSIKKKKTLNPLPNMPILGWSIQQQIDMSKLWTNGDIIS